MTAPLLTLEQFTALRAGGEDTEQAQLDGVIADIRTYCGWHIAPVLTETIVLDGSGAREFILPTLRLKNLVSVTERGTLLDETAYEWSHDGRVRRYGHWTCSYRGLSVVAEHGFDTVPADLVKLILSAASTAIDDAGAEELPEKMGPFEFGPRTDGFTRAQRSILDRYTVAKQP